MKKILIIMTFLLMFSMSFSYEDNYKKIYIVKISKTEIYQKMNVTEDQKKKLNKLFESYKNRVKLIEASTIQYDNKKEKIDNIERERYQDLAKILTSDQMLIFNEYINSKKMEFSAKNDKIARTIDQLDLTNEQKSDILKVERDFDRSLEKLTVKSISSPEFMSEYEKLKVIRNEGVMSILTAEQKKLLKQYITKNIDLFIAINYNQYINEIEIKAMIRRVTFNRC